MGRVLRRARARLRGGRRSGGGAAPAGEFYAGWLTEYSLSVDNLFVFVIIMARFAVPREQQQRVLMVGIIVALVLRGRSSWRARRSSRSSCGCSTCSARSSCTRRSSSWRGRRTRGVPREPGRAGAAPGPAARHPVRRRPAAHGRGRQASLHAARRRVPRDRQHRPAVRVRLHPCHLRAHAGPVHRLHDERVRPDGPAPALLPAGACSSGSSTCRSGWPSSSASSASSSSSRRCTRTRCRSSTAASTSRRCRRSPSGSRSW